MMQECPKCGFVQPKDRYCANCGLDIDNYKPAPTPMITKLKRNTLLHVLVATIIIVTLAVSIFMSQKDRIAAHFNSLPNVLTKTDDGSNRSGYTPSTVSSEKLKTDTSNAAVTTSASPEKMAATTKANSPQGRTLVVEFMEVSKTAISMLASEGQFLGDSATLQAFYFQSPDAIAKIKERDPEAKSLAGGTQAALSPNSPMTFNFTYIAANSPDEIGLNLVINPASAENSIEVEINGELHLKNELNATIAAQQISTQFNIPADSALVLNRLLPQQSIRSEDQENFSNTPLVIYDSVDFISGATDMAIVIYVK